ncbi:MAG: protein kinase [Deltaproteobacteria bacterium]|nr:protein kinase [Deltaproteobacteria bacterium]
MEMLGAYRVIRKLGEGGMGEVLLGRAPDDALVVLKVPLHPSKETAARLQDEARVGFRLRHDNIVKTRDFFFDGKKPVLVIDFVDGASLKDLREEVGPLPAVMVAHIGKQIASALSLIHNATDEAGKPLHMLHRDVTPGNILVNRQGQALLIDLGIARSDENTAGKTSTGMLKGTFRYLSPDLFSGMPYSSGTDLWALGVTLFESAVGRKAAKGNQNMVLAAILQGHILDRHDDERVHQLLERTFYGLLRTDDRTRRLTDANRLSQIFAQIESKLGNGAEVARRVMATQPQGDVSGEFGADDQVPTILDNGLMNLPPPPSTSSGVFANSPWPVPPVPASTSSDVFGPAAIASLPPQVTSSGFLPMSTVDEQARGAPTMTLPHVDASASLDRSGLSTQVLRRVPPVPQAPTVVLPRVSTSIDPLATLAIPIIVVEEDIDMDMSEFSDLPEVPARVATPSSDAAPTTVGMLAMQMPSSMAPPTVMLNASHATPGSSDAAPTVMLNAVDVSSPRGAPPPHNPGSDDAAPTRMLAAVPTAPRPKPKAVAKPTLDIPIFVDGDDVDMDD